MYIYIMSAHLVLWRHWRMGGRPAAQGRYPPLIGTYEARLCITWPEAVVAGQVMPCSIRLINTVYRFRKSYTG